MKNVLKTTSLTLLILMYGLVVSLCNSGVLFQNPVFIQQHSQQSSEIYRSEISKSLFSHTAPQENSISVVSNTITPSFKNQFIDFGEILRITNQLLITRFLQNDFFSKNILFRLQRHDIIFPFHSFW